MLRKVIILFLVFWLPLQGVAALAMPFCEHMAAGVAHEHAQVQHDGHDAHHGGGDGNAAHGDDANQAPCDQCGLCHIACAQAVPPGGGAVAASAQPMHIPFAETPYASPSPEPLFRPPLAAAA